MPSTDESQPTIEGEGEAHATAMNDQLKKDVASWSAAKSQTATADAEAFRVAVAKPPTRPAATRAKRAAPVAADVSKAPDVPAKKKPFGMSYDGVTEADYISYVIARGGR
jgi:hypothetical protein